MSKVPWAEHGFLVPVAHRIRREVGIPTATSSEKADGYIRDGQLDLVLLGKALLDDPHWP